MLRRSGSFLLALVFSLAGGSASAATYSLLGTIPSPSSAHTVQFNILGQTKSALAVGFSAEYDGVAGVSFCGDLLHTVAVPASYQGSPIALGTLAAGYTAAAKMVNRWATDLGSLSSSVSDAAAGLQLALWETIYGGGFTILSSLDAGTQAAYDTVLGADYSSSGVGNVVFLDVTSATRNKQDHFFKPGGPAVPEPGAVLLFSTGLMVVARSLRRS